MQAAAQLVQMQAWLVIWARTRKSASSAQMLKGLTMIASLLSVVFQCYPKRLPHQLMHHFVGRQRVCSGLFKTLTDAMWACLPRLMPVAALTAFRTM